MLLRLALAGLLLLLTGVSGPSAAAAYLASPDLPPAPQREFRGAWVASVSNIDWPSKPGLTTAEQKTELLAILDQAKKLKLNAVILQVRPACDALYASKLEPWSEYLTGQMGRAPEPYYDPLAFAVTEAHQRGLELHAWFNPYRARHTSSKSLISSSHITRTRPGIVRQYGKQLWLDPGEKAVQDYSIGVIMDVVQRYDIDGVHLDDYFYPYKEKDSSGKSLDFPDGSTWKRYVDGGGKLTRDDWRRDNVNTFVQHLHTAIKGEKTWVKFGISPFGIWRPGNPPQVKGMDAYNEIYADSRKWLNSGWVDYFAPQLYWPADSREQSFPALLKWWADQNTRQRHLWPGISISRTSSTRPPKETVNEIQLTRGQPGATGNILWSTKTLMQNRDGLTDALRKGPYTSTALVPASPWLDAKAPGKPSLSVIESASGESSKLSWGSTNGQPVWLWVFQTRAAGKWTAEIISGSQSSGILSSAPDAVAISAVSRCGVISPPMVLERKTSVAK